eukprot:s2034_g7.t1
MRWSLQRHLAGLLLQLCGSFATERILAIGAANSEIDWTLVQSAATVQRPWLIDELLLPDFGRKMMEKGFQHALEDAEKLILINLFMKKPDVLLLQSKGVGIATYLAFHKIWQGPLVLLSPIPNACDHISGGSWEAEWNSTMQLLRSTQIVAIGTGNSNDEQEFIVRSMEETEVCGKIRHGTTSHSFELKENAKHIARLIDSMVHRVLDEITRELQAKLERGAQRENEVLTSKVVSAQQEFLALQGEFKTIKEEYNQQLEGLRLELEEQQVAADRADRRVKCAEDLVRFHQEQRRMMAGHWKEQCQVKVADTFIKFVVSLPSSRHETITVSQFGTIADLKKAAQESLGRRFLTLVKPDGRLLNPADSLQLSGLQDGDSITAVAQQPMVAATRNAFALWYVGDDRVVTWGDPCKGGDSSRVQHQLRNVQQICGTYDAFAAILADGTVVTWGSPGSGGDSSGVQHQLRNVKQICGADHAFAAVLADGGIVTWGTRKSASRCKGVQSQLKDVKQISCTAHSFAALLADGNVVTWGTPGTGGDSSSVQQQLKNVQQICSTFRAFAALLEDGNVVTWGDPHCGGDSSRVQHQLKHVHKISGAFGAFVAILADGSAVIWGHHDDSSRVQHKLKNAQQICHTYEAFAAILADGSVVTWGNPDHGGDSSRVQHQLKNVLQICSTQEAFAAILADGSVVTWGNRRHGGDSSRVQHQLKNVKQIWGAYGAFVAVLADGGIVTWGDPDRGGDSCKVQSQFSYI